MAGSRFVLSLLSGLLLAGCCLGGLPGATPPPPPTPLPPVTPPPPVGVGPYVPPPPPATVLYAGVGMSPDPAVATGSAGGPMPASALSPTCWAGSYPIQPQVTLQVGSMMPTLVIFADGERDLTLAVRRPDGSFACDDDGDVGLNPRVAEPGMPGTYSIYVGTFGSEPVPFVVGVTGIAAMAAPLLTEGTVLRHGNFSVLSSTGPAAVAPGSLCEYVEVSHAARTGDVNVRWRVVCSGRTIYGDGSSEGSAGFSYSSHPDWPAGTTIRDAETSAVDSDPAFVWDTTGIRISDDAAGYGGAHETVLTEVF